MKKIQSQLGFFKGKKKLLNFFLQTQMTAEPSQEFQGNDIVY